MSGFPFLVFVLFLSRSFEVGELIWGFEEMWSADSFWCTGYRIMYNAFVLILATLLWS